MDRKEPPMCKRCFGDIPQENNPTLTCPNCGTINTAPEEPPPPPPDNPNLRMCRDCMREISVNADACPHCGAALKKRRGVFFYVFWGTVSLIGTVFILSIVWAITTGVFIGIGSGIDKAINHDAKTKTPPPRVEALSANQIEQAKSILAKASKHRDKVTGATFLEPEWTTSGYENSVFVYIGTSDKGSIWLRLKIRYKGESPLFIKQFVIRADSEVNTVDATGDMKSDFSGSSSWEWYDGDADEMIPILRNLMGANTSIVRFRGVQSYEDHDLTRQEKNSIADMLLLYDYLKSAPAATGAAL